MTKPTPEYTSETQPTARAARAKAGYSLLEILIAMAIIALMASLVGPRVFNQFSGAQVTAAKAQVQSIETSLDTMRLDIGRYPSQDEGLAMLISPPSDEATRKRWYGPYFDGETMPLDPWGNPYQYAAPRVSSQRAGVWSFGADGKPGGSGNDADLGHVQAY